MDVLDTLVGLIEISRGEMEGKVENGVFDDLIVVIDSLKVMKSSLLDEVVLSVALNSIEVRNFQGEDVKSRHLEHKFILMLDSCLMSIEESQKFAT